MGFFSHLRRSIKKSKLMKTAAAKADAMQMDAAIDDVYEFLVQDDLFSTILNHFNATRDDIHEIARGLMSSGAGGHYHGHFVPVSALLFPDTLAYLLRSQRGQVEKRRAYFEIMDYFQRGAIIFEPESAFH